MTTPMLPTPPDCGSPCAMCESYAHLLAKAREELESVRKGSARVCRELREEIARLQGSWAGWFECVDSDGVRLAAFPEYDLARDYSDGTGWTIRPVIDAAKWGCEVSATCIHHNDAERAAAGCPVCMQADNAALRNGHAAIYLALGTNEADHTKWPAQIVALRAALERIALYRAVNGDTWPADQARAALANVGDQPRAGIAATPKKKNTL